MYAAKNIYQKKVNYINQKSFDFFKESKKLAIESYNKGIVYNKKDSPVVFGTSINQFNPLYDKVLIRKEMNQRGILRDFVGVDWDFELEQKDLFKKAYKGCVKFSKQFNTPIFIYPTSSFPESPRFRSIFFLEDCVNQNDYLKAYEWFINFIGVDPNDNNNIDIKHQFNLPVITNDSQLKYMIFLNQNHFNPISKDCYINTTVKHRLYHSSYKIKPKNINKTELAQRNDNDVKKAIKYINKQYKKAISKEENSIYNFDDYNNFAVKFLHSLARAEIIGSINHQQAEMILIGIAGENERYKRQNIIDYNKELIRVRDIDGELLKASPFSLYAGMNW